MAKRLKISWFKIILGKKKKKKKLNAITNMRTKCIVMTYVLGQKSHTRIDHSFFGTNHIR